MQAESQAVERGASCAALSAELNALKEELCTVSKESGAKLSELQAALNKSERKCAQLEQAATRSVLEPGMVL